MNKEILHLHNYKCFSDQSLVINNLTVLVGSNGAGKSTTIQSLLLLHSSLKEKNSIVDLDGIFGLDLGTGASVVNMNSNDDTISFSLSSDINPENKIECKYKADIIKEKLNLDITDQKIIDDSFSILKDEFYYLSAERRGPRVSQPLVSMKFLSVGIEGENTAQVIAHDSGRTKVDQKRIFIDSENPNLEYQVNAWLSHILPGVKVTASMDTKTLTAQLRIGNIFTISDTVVATNFGFGVSYFLPIIVECLVAKENSMLIIENPEAHLHPAAQTAIGVFLARMAFSGLRIVLETHSDHVISGIQRFVVEQRDWHDHVTINNFGINQDDNSPLITPIEFDENGNFSTWPDGFMDQNQKDYIELCKVRDNEI